MSYVSLKPSLLAVSISALFSVAATAGDFTITGNLGPNAVPEGTSNDTISTSKAQTYVNSGTIAGYGKLYLGSWHKLQNEKTGLIDVASYESQDGHGEIINAGTVVINKPEFNLSLSNSGKVLVKGDTLTIERRGLEVKEGSTITNSLTGERLKQLTVNTWSAPCLQGLIKFFTAQAPRRSI